MQEHVPQFTSYAIAALVIFAVYRRFRRTFGRQLFSPTRLYVRIGLFLLFAALIVGGAVRSLPMMLGLAVGLLGGVVLALWGASQTRFESAEGVRYYIPHTYTGAIVSALFLGRLAYRFIAVYPLKQAATGLPDGAANYVSSPLTVGLFFVLVGYYVCYYSLLLRRANSAQFGASGLAGTPLNGDTSKPA